MIREKRDLNNGFTIAEVLVVILIIGILSAIVFSSYGNNNKSLSLSRAAQTLAQDLRRTQQMSMGSLEGTSGVTAGYGMYFVSPSSSYIIFRNDTYGSLNTLYAGAETDPTQESITIEKGTKICDIKINGASIGSGSLSVFFLPPDPITYLNGTYSGATASIVLCLEADESRTLTVEINNSGMIDILN